MDRIVANGCVPTSAKRPVYEESWLYAQALLGNVVHSTYADEADKRAEREHLEWLATVSSAHEGTRRSLLEQERHAKEERSQLEWLASISERHERELQRQLTHEAAAREARSRFERLFEALSVQEAEWDPAKHPRLGGPPNAGWFATTGGAVGSGGANAAAKKPTQSTIANASTDAEPAPPTKSQLPAGNRGSWISGTKGDGVFRYNNSIENQKAGLAGKEVRFESQNIAVGGLPAEAYYGGSATVAKVEVDVVTGTGADNRAADAAMRKKLGKPEWRRPTGYVWNHAGPSGSKVMELVKESTHAATSHKGPAAEPRAARRAASTRGGTGRATGRAMGALTVYLTAREAMQATGALHPDYAQDERETYHFVADDGSVFIVHPSGLFSDAKREYVDGPRKGQTEKIAKEQVDAYIRQAEEEWGKYIPGSLISGPRFIPGKKRDSLPLIEYRNGVPYDIGLINEDGVHYYSSPRMRPI